MEGQINPTTHIIYSFKDAEVLHMKLQGLNFDFGLKKLVFVPLHAVLAHIQQSLYYTWKIGAEAAEHYCKNTHC